jgi:hypothetical protein
MPVPSDKKIGGTRAWVVFTGKTDIRWLKWLKRGYRHCYVLLNDGVRWVSIDPAASQTQIIVYHHLSPDFDLPHWLREEGVSVVACRVKPQAVKRTRFALLTCVETVKRILGIHRFGLITPWQLYCHLHTQSSKQGEYHG